MKKQFVQFAAGLGVFAVASVLLLFFPYFSVLYLPVCLAVFTALNFSGERWQSILLFVIGFFANVIINGSFTAALLCVALPFIFSLIAVPLFKKEMPEKPLTFVFGLANIIFFVGMLLFAKDEIGGIENLFSQLSDNFNQNLDLFVQQGIIDLEYKDSYITQLELVLEQLKLMVPAMLFVYSAVIGYVTVWAVWLVSKLVKPGFIYRPAFSKFKCNTVTSGMTILVCILSIFIKDGVFGVAIDNAFTIFSFLLCVCTASLADYWLKGKNWVTIVRIIIVLFLLSNYSSSILSLLMCLIAIADARADFRKLEH